MSLLTRGNQTVVIYHSEAFTDEDGNLLYRPSSTDVETLSNCIVQVAAQSGTSARRAEQDEEGYDTEQVYRFRPPQYYTRRIHFASQIEWDGVRWSIIGHAKLYRANSRTRHDDYTLRRV